MSKILLTADLHIYPHRRDQRRTDDCLECLEWIYTTAKQQKCKYVIVAGDLFHDRFLIHSYVYSKASNIVMAAKENGINTIFLVGNHDLFYEDNWTVHSLMPLHGISQVIQTPSTVEIDGFPVDFLPYTSSPSKYINEFKNPSPILVSHLPVAEAILNARFNIKSVEDDSHDKEILPVSAFSRWEKVMLGHYHYGQKLNDIVEYIGSPMALSFGEADQVKHVAIIDLKTLHTEYVVNDISPGFHIIDNEKQLDSINLKNAYIQFRTNTNIIAKFDMRKRLELGGAREIEFIPPKYDIADQTNNALSKVAAVINNKDQVIEQFVDNCKLPSGLDRDLLKKIGKSICS